MSNVGFTDRIYLYFWNGAIGEVVNTLVCGTSMQEFDSLMTPHFWKLSMNFDLQIDSMIVIEFFCASKSIRCSLFIPILRFGEKKKRTCKSSIFMLFCMWQEILRKIKKGTFRFCKLNVYPNLIVLGTYSSEWVLFFYNYYHKRPILRIDLFCLFITCFDTVVHIISRWIDHNRISF